MRICEVSESFKGDIGMLVPVGIQNPLFMSFATGAHELLDVESVVSFLS